MNLIVGNRPSSPVTRIEIYKLLFDSGVRVDLVNYYYSSGMKMNIVSFNALFI